MIGLRVDQAKKNFFDRAAIISRLTPAERRVLSKFGAFVRTSARSSIRYTKKAVSKPGQPPRSHTRDRFLTLRNILFSYDPFRKSVVIGPVKLNKKQIIGIDKLSGTVPQILEHGGSVGLREKQRSPGGKWGPIGRRRILRPGESVRVRSARYEARPYMRPAFEKNKKDELPKLWRNAV